MIDWISAFLPFTHSEPITDGSFLEFNSAGVVINKYPRRSSLRGSYESSILIKTDYSTTDSVGRYTQIKFDGNVAKFFQGHNLFGSNDLHGLVVSIYHEIFHILGMRPSCYDYSILYSGQYRLTRVDVTSMLNLGTDAAVDAMLFALSNTATMQYRGKATTRGNTVYFGQRSTYSAQKFYNKTSELAARGHHLPMGLQLPSLKNYALGRLRHEVTLRSRALVKLNLQYGYQWVDNTSYVVTMGYLNSMSITNPILDDHPNLLLLSTSYRLTYQLWRKGADVRSEMPRKTFYRHRKKIMSVMNVDISIQLYPKMDLIHQDNIYSFDRYRKLEAVKDDSEPPYWATGTILLFEPDYYSPDKQLSAEK